jgi:hypothetical protein
MLSFTDWKAQQNRYLPVEWYWKAYGSYCSAIRAGVEVTPVGTGPSYKDLLDQSLKRAEAYNDIGRAIVL